MDIKVNNLGQYVPEGEEQLSELLANLDRLGVFPILVKNFKRIPKIRGRFYLVIDGDTWPEDIEVVDGAFATFDVLGKCAPSIAAFGSRVRIHACEGSRVEVEAYHHHCYVEAEVLDGASVKAKLHDSSRGKFTVTGHGRAELILSDSSSSVFSATQGSNLVFFGDGSTNACGSLLGNAKGEITARGESSISLRLDDESRSKVFVRDDSMARIVAKGRARSTLRMLGGTIASVRVDGEAGLRIDSPFEGGQGLALNGSWSAVGETNRAQAIVRRSGKARVSLVGRGIS